MRRGSEISSNGGHRERKLAGAPISWGVCEVPGWGHQLPPDRVLAEMASVGLSATELGPVGYMSEDPGQVRDLLERFELDLVASFVPLALHERPDPLGEHVLELLAALEGEVLVVTPVMDAEWSAPRPLERAEWRRMADNLAALEELAGTRGVTVALHPHAGAVVETEEQIERILGASTVPCCLDTGHLTIGGADPVRFARRHADRIVHVHLKDVDAELASRVGEGELSLVEATRLGLFKPLGAGDADIAAVVGALDSQGYERWLVLEQDTTLTGEEPPVGSGPVLDVQASIEYLASLAPANGGGISQR